MLKKKSELSELQYMHFSTILLVYNFICDALIKVTYLLLGKKNILKLMCSRNAIELGKTFRNGMTSL